MNGKMRAHSYLDMKRMKAPVMAIGPEMEHCRHKTEPVALLRVHPGEEARVKGNALPDDRWLLPPVEWIQCALETGR